MTYSKLMHSASKNPVLPKPNSMKSRLAALVPKEVREREEKELAEKRYSCRKEEMEVMEAIKRSLEDTKKAPETSVENKTTE